MENQHQTFRYVATKAFGGTAWSGDEQLTFSYAEGEAIADDVPGPLLVDWLKRGRIKKVTTNNQPKGTNTNEN